MLTKTQRLITHFKAINVTICHANVTINIPHYCFYRPPCASSNMPSHKASSLFSSFFVHYACLIYSLPFVYFSRSFKLIMCQYFPCILIYFSVLFLPLPTYPISSLLNYLSFSFLTNPIYYPLSYSPFYLSLLFPFQLILSSLSTYRIPLSFSLP